MLQAIYIKGGIRIYHLNQQFEDDHTQYYFSSGTSSERIANCKKIQLLYSRDTNVVITLYFWCASYLRSFIRNYLVLLFMMHSLSYNKIVNWGERTQLMWLLDFIVGWLQWSDYSLTVHLPAHLWGWIFVKCSNTDPPFSLYSIDTLSSTMFKCLHCLFAEKRFLVCFGVLYAMSVITLLHKTSVMGKCNGHCYLSSSSFRDSVLSFCSFLMPLMVKYLLIRLHENWGSLLTPKAYSSRILIRKTEADNSVVKFSNWIPFILSTQVLAILSYFKMSWFHLFLIMS